MQECSGYSCSGNESQTIDMMIWGTNRDNRENELETRSICTMSMHISSTIDDNNSFELDSRPCDDLIRLEGLSVRRSDSTFSKYLLSAMKLLARSTCLIVRPNLLCWTRPLLIFWLLGSHAFFSSLLFLTFLHLHESSLCSFLAWRWSGLTAPFVASFISFNANMTTSIIRSNESIICIQFPAGSRHRLLSLQWHTKDSRQNITRHRNNNRLADSLNV